MGYQIFWQTGASNEHQVTFSRDLESHASQNETVEINGYSYSLKGAQEDVSLLLDSLRQRSFASPEEFQNALRQLSTLSNQRFQQISAESPKMMRLTNITIPIMAIRF